MDVIIIGGGAAGLMCAIEAGKRGRTVLVLERAESIGKKIRISGGGRCNFTNLYTQPENFISANPNFHKSALARYTPDDFIRLVERHGIKYHEKKLGQLFCDGSSEEIISMLLHECRTAGVQIRLGCHVQQVARNDRFDVATNKGVLQSQSLVIATGGLSIPRAGATDFGYQAARQFGLNIIPTRAALVPLILNDEDERSFLKLSGVSVNCIVETNGAAFHENMLFTHHGVSGPAILQISSYWKTGEALRVNLFPGIDIGSELMLQHGTRVELSTVLSRHLPKRFVEQWCKTYEPSRPLAQYSEQNIHELADRLQHWTLHPAGTEGYKKAEVTAGGVDTEELSSKTMEARKIPGLYFIGEVVDVTGQLGGYNFQWAWASGFIAGQYV